MEAILDGYPNVALSLPSSEIADADWASLLEAIGTQFFERALKRFLSDVAGPRACVALLHEVIGEIVTCRNCADLTDVSLATRACPHPVIGSPHWIHFEGGIAVAIPGLLHWTQASELSNRLAGTGRALSAILRKHKQEADDASVQREPLACLRTIEQCLGESTKLPAREVEVCSRILFGLSSAGIAIDLDICETTIKTYRKRAYQRLSIGCERELITWYLRTWSGWWRSRRAATRAAIQWSSPDSLRGPGAEALTRMSRELT